MARYCTERRSPSACTWQLAWLLNWAASMTRLVERQQRLLKRLDLPTSFAAAEPEALWQAMQHDKKVEHGKLRFILPDRMGHVELVAGITQEQAIAAMRA